jgi:acyl-CoA synthetase (AMP-forming)/AMP-acid ligase II
MGPDDPATIFYTSGTTSRPKGAIGTHRNALTNIFSSSFTTMRAALRRGAPASAPSPKVVLLTIPFFHVTGCNARLLGSMWNGDTLVLMHRWNVDDALALIARERVNNAGGVPTIGWQLVDHPDCDRYDHSSLESITYGGAPAAPDLVRRIKSRSGASPGCGWGMTETSATVTSHNGDDYLARPDSAGPAVPVAQLRIMDGDGRTECPVGTVGELWVKGPMVVRGYWNRPEATAETFVDGWCRTGDLARLDDEGFLFIVDRAKDMVIRGGENIYSIEVENVLFDHPAVTDCALVPIPHRTLGEEPGAVVQLSEHATATEVELQDWVRQRLAGFKVPVRIVFFDAPLPRNANGKILKKELAGLFAVPAAA